MEYIKTLFKNTHSEELKESLQEVCSKLRVRKYTFSYHVEGDQAAVLVTHNNPHKLLNGVIFAYPSFTPIIETYRLFYHVPSILKNAQFYAIRDGTTVYLYFFQGEWRIASAKSVNISSSKIRGFETMALLLECDSKLFSRLDQSKSYSIGFTNTKIHHSTSGNSIWNNDFDTEIEGIPHLPQVDEICSSNSYSEYGTLIVFPGSRNRYIKYSKLFNDLRQLKYCKKINKDIEYNGYDYYKYIKLHAWLKSDVAFQKLRHLENNSPELDQFEKEAQQLLADIRSKKNKTLIFYDLEGDRLNDGRIEFIRNVNNIDMFYSLLFSE